MPQLDDVSPGKYVRSADVDITTIRGGTNVCQQRIAVLHEILCLALQNRSGTREHKSPRRSLEKSCPYSFLQLFNLLDQSCWRDVEEPAALEKLFSWAHTRKALR